MAKKQLNILTKLKYYIQYIQSLGFDQRAHTQFQGYDLDHYRFGTFSRGVFRHYTKFMIVIIQKVCEFVV